MRWGVGEERSDEDRAGHSLRGDPPQFERVLRALGETHHERPLGAGRVHYRKAIAGGLIDVVAPRVAAAVGAPVAEAVHRQHPEVAREVGDLHLPVARVDDRPGRQQEDRLLALAVDLVEEPLPVALDKPFGIGVASTALLRRTAKRFPIERR